MQRQRQRQRQKQEIGIKELETDFPGSLHHQIDEITEGIPKVINKNLRMLSEDNIKTVIRYVNATNTEINLSANYRKDIIELLTRFARFYADKIAVNKDFKFKDVTREDIIKFLDSHRKLKEEDPLNRWVGTYNTYLIHITRFFKWLYAQDTAAKERKKPAVVDNIPKLHRKQTSIYKPSDMWTPEDDLLFLSYCPSKRDRCYHAISRDLSARPAEILSLKIKDAVFKTVASGRQYCEVTVNGKTGERHLPLINSLPYLKDYLDDHPMRNNPHAPFICGIGKSLGRHLTPIGIFKMYAKYKEEVFPKLLESPNVLPGDKQRITELLKKRWNPYVRRHSSLTEKSVFLKENVLRQYAGWTQDSQMHKRYLHYFGNEATNNILEEYGLIDKSKQLNPLQPKQCPNCSESNKPDSKFCSRCRMVLSYDSYNEVIQQQEKQQMEMERLDDLVRDLATIKERLGIQ